MTISDDIRQHVLVHYVRPAREKGQASVSIRAGDVHKELGFTDRLPNVCSALGSNKFEEFAGVKRLSIEGPSNGSNAVFTFRV